MAPTQSSKETPSPSPESSARPARQRGRERDHSARRSEIPAATSNHLVRRDPLSAFSQQQLTAIALILFVVSVGLAIWAFQLQGNVQHTKKELAAVTLERDTLRQQANATSYHLVATADGPPTASATVFFTVEGSGVLSASNLPKLGTNQNFQLWYQPANCGALIPGGTFGSDPQGNGFMLIPSDVGTFNALSISIEPASGSTVPTGAMVLKGDVNGARG
ncbi:MAG: anti-sigma factor [Thermomicrobiales bacterium]